MTYYYQNIQIKDNCDAIDFKHKKTSDVFDIVSKPIAYMTGDMGNMNEFHDAKVIMIEKRDKASKSKEKLSTKEKDEPSSNKFDSSEDYFSSNWMKEALLSPNNSKINIRPYPKRLSSKEFMQTLYNKGAHRLNHEDDITNPYIYSNFEVTPFSYLFGQKRQGYKNGRLIAPSPLYIENEEWMKKPDLTRNGVLQGMLIKDEVGLILVDKQMKKKFHGILSDFIAQLLKAALGHRISLMIKLFEPKSFLQRTTDDWLFAPKFLPVASQKKHSALERMKFVMAFGLSSLYLSTKQLKPFNPLICETFQGEFENTNTKVYLEQVLNYPNTSRFLITDEDYKVYGYFNLNMITESLGTEVSVYSKGPTTVDFFKINEKITFMLPTAHLNHASSENNRSELWINTMVFVDIKNNLKGIIQFNRDDKCFHNIQGAIIKYKFPNDYIFDYDKEMIFGNSIDLNKRKKSNYVILSKITGSWLLEFIADGKRYWDIDKDMPYWIRPIKECLPSDSRFREDIIWLYRSYYFSKTEGERLKYEDLAQQWKLIIEQNQREERDLKKKKLKTH